MYCFCSFMIEGSSKGTRPSRRLSIWIFSDQKKPRVSYMTHVASGWSRFARDSRGEHWNQWIRYRLAFGKIAFGKNAIKPILGNHRKIRISATFRILRQIVGVFFPIDYDFVFVAAKFAPIRRCVRCTSQCAFLDYAFLRDFSSDSLLYSCESNLQEYPMHYQSGISLRSGYSRNRLLRKHLRAIF